MTIWFFLQILLEMPIPAPKILFFLRSETLNVIGHHRDPQRHILGRKRTSMPILVQIDPLVRPGRETKKSKKEKRKKARKETYSGKLGIRPDYPR